MKKRIFAVLFAMMMLAGCGGAEEQEQQVAMDPVLEQIYAEEEPQVEGAAMYLQRLPEEITAEVAAEEGFYMIKDGVATNQEAWDLFMENCENDRDASVVVCQYTVKGGAVLDYVLHFAGEEGYTVITDMSRDGYADEQSVLKAPRKFTDLDVFENFTLQEGVEGNTICVLSDEPELTADDFREYWNGKLVNKDKAEDMYMLFVI